MTQSSYSEKKIKELNRADRKFVWHPFTQMQDWLTEEPVIIQKGRGNYLFDIQGRKYLDAISSLWVTVHGHAHPFINAAIKKQVDLISHSTLLGLSNVPATELAEKIIKIAPKGLKKVFYSDSGSTAVEIALKMAYQYFCQTTPNAKRDIFITFKNAYHGDTLGSVSVGGIELFHQIYKPLLMKNLIADFDNIEAIIKANASRVAAVIIEPMIQGAAGMLLQPKGFLKKLRAMCDKHGLLLIFDEVATGFGRTGKMFACQHEGVSPDILCIAKGLSGGYLPVAATLTTQKIFDGFLAPHKDLKTFFHGHTFTGNPLACAAAIASLDLFKKNRVLAKLPAKIRILKTELKKIAKHPNVGEIRQLGLMVGIELCQSKNPLVEYDYAQRMGAKVCQAARERGLMLRPLGNVLVFMPPLSITPAQIRFLVKTTLLTIAAVCPH
jgi:adenosylmethionine-8-amino-7-oxononanoate aminotransferase